MSIEFVVMVLLLYICVCVGARARARAPVFNKVRCSRFLFFFTLCSPRAYWRNAEKGQVVTVVTGKAAAAVTGKRVRRLRARRRAIQRCVCAKKKKSARATRARTGNVTVAETLPFAGVGVGRETAYRLEVG